MKRISLVRVISLLIAITGIVVMMGWIFHLRILTSITPNHVSMMFNTAFCFFISGITLFLVESQHLKSKKIYILSGVILSLISGLTLIQYQFGVSFGIDGLLMKPFPYDQDIIPGRMSVNTAVGFLLTGIAFLILSKPTSQFRSWLLQALIIGILAIGFSALLGYLLDLNFLYSWFRFSKMAIHTSIAFTLLGTTLWIIWSKSQSFENFYNNRQDKKILFFSMLILFIIASVSSLFGFFISAKQDEVVMQRYLQDTLKDRTHLLNDSIRLASQEMTALQNNKEFIKIIFDDFKEDLTAITKLLLNTSFSAIKILSNDNQAIYSAGDFLKNPNAIIPIDNTSNASIVWDGRFYLEKSAIIKNRLEARKVILQWPIETINELIKNSGAQSSKGYFICYLNTNQQINCLPPGYNTGKEYGLISDSDKSALKNHIIKNIPAFINNTHLGTGHYILAYMPIQLGHMGLVQKSDIAAINEPVSARLILVVMVLLFVVSLGAILLYLMVSPLVNNLINTRNKLQESEERLRLAFDSSAIGMALVSLSGTWLKVNQALCDILRYPSDQLVENDYQRFIAPEDYDLVKSKINDLIKHNSDSFKIECRYITREGNYIWILLNQSIIRSSDSHSEHFIASYQDITKEKEVEEKLYYQARHDILTGLVNRVELKERLSNIMAASQRSKSKFAIFFIDLDKFKQINDTLGHEAGDRLLKVIAERLTSYTRKTDVVCRLGGDEFVLVLTDLHELKTAALFAERIINLILNPVMIKGRQLFVTASIGISFYPDDGLDADELLKNADIALYRAKDDGRNNYQFCAPEVSTEIHKKIAFENDIRLALDRGEFQIYYQPQINPHTREVISLEGLLRWQSSHHGLVSPNQIIPIAEETGLIIPLSEWIIQTASSQVKAIQLELNRKIKLSINISARHFMHEKIIESITDALEMTQYSADQFVLEINENLIMQDPDKTIEIITVLKKYGIGILVDNFGTGYSSFKYLQDFSVDAVKIDRSIVSDMVSDSKRADLVFAMIAFAKHLGIRVIGEGVETQAQYDYLVAHGCDEIQGFFITRPLLADQAANFIRDYKRNPVKES